MEASEWAPDRSVQRLLLDNGCCQAKASVVVGPFCAHCDVQQLIVVVFSMVQSSTVTLSTRSCESNGNFENFNLFIKDGE